MELKNKKEIIKNYNYIIMNLTRSKIIFDFINSLELIFLPKLKK